MDHILFFIKILIFIDTSCKRFIARCCAQTKASLRALQGLVVYKYISNLQHF